MAQYYCKKFFGKRKIKIINNSFKKSQISKIPKYFISVICKPILNEYIEHANNVCTNNLKFEQFLSELRRARHLFCPPKPKSSK